MIKRSNGSKVYSVNIPLEIIQSKGWDKGDNLNFEEKPEVVELKKEGE